MAEGADHAFWLEWGSEDLRAARTALNEGYARMASWFFRLGSERILRGAAVSAGRTPSRAITLNGLIDLIAPGLGQDDPARRAAEVLSDMTPDRNYPSDRPEPTIDEARQYGEAARTLESFARERLSPPA